MNAKSGKYKTDWVKFDAHVITPEEYDELPELTGEDFERATPMIGGREASWDEFKEAAKAQIQRGRPKSENNKVLLSVRYSPEVVEYFKTTGRGWQARMDAALKEWVKAHSG